MNKYLTKFKVSSFRIKKHVNITNDNSVGTAAKVNGNSLQKTKENQPHFLENGNYPLIVTFTDIIIGFTFQTERPHLLLYVNSTASI